MLKRVISKANLILKDAQQHLTTQAADAVGKVKVSIENLNNFINIEMDRIEKDPKLGHRGRSAARREVLEHSGRKLEILKDRNNYSNLVQESDHEMPVADEQDDNALLNFMREREIRDRLYGKTETQILSHFGDSLFNGRNRLLLNAILNCPPGFEMLSEPNLRKLRRIKVQMLTTRTGAKPEFHRKANASIMEIFTLAKKELDRLRKKEMVGSNTKK